MKSLNDKDYVLMGLPERFRNANWAFMQKHGLASDFEKYLRNLSLAKEQGIGCFIGGIPSSGKSYSAAVIAKAFRQNFFSVQWLDAIEGYQLLSWNRDFPDAEYGTWMTRALAVDLLIVDNFGAEKATNRTKILLDVVKRRVDLKLPTVLTTTQTPNQLSVTYDGESMAWIKDAMKVVELKKRIESENKKFIADNF
jgi:DNA replication protein DnaC